MHRYDKGLLWAAVLLLAASLADGWPSWIAYAMAGYWIVYAARTYWLDMIKNDDDELEIWRRIHGPRG